MQNKFLRSPLLTISQMQVSDQFAITNGISGLCLMRLAGQAVAKAIEDYNYGPGKVIVLVGPGNNGGDGFYAAHLLRERGYRVHLYLLGERRNLSGDAAQMADLWAGPIAPFDELYRLANEGTSFFTTSFIIDAVFGAGLCRPVDGPLADFFAFLNDIKQQPDRPQVIAVDVPSGLNGDTGHILGTAIRANKTVSFFHPKPGHYLYPGREICGELFISDIGIPKRALGTVAPKFHLNNPSLWIEDFPQFKLTDHKYHAGSLLVVAGKAEMSGAAQLGAYAALKSGTGLVTLIGKPEAMGLIGHTPRALMKAAYHSEKEFKTLLSDERKNAVLIGPGRGVSKECRREVLTVLLTGKKAVLDADALSSFAGKPQEFLSAVIKGGGQKPNIILTPHEGEFNRLFPDHLLMELTESKNADIGKEPSKLDRALMAAKQSHCIIVLKGADTVIASPDGEAVINFNAPSSLATAGSGDVLGGIIAGFLAQGMPSFASACAGVWLHSECANQIARDLIADDLIAKISGVKQQLFTSTEVIE